MHTLGFPNWARTWYVVPPADEGAGRAAYIIGYAKWGLVQMVSKYDNMES